jgi:hypothetical protein
MWRSKQLLLLLLFTTLVGISFFTYNHGNRQFYTFKALHRAGIHFTSKTTKPFLSPLPDGCPTSPEADANSNSTVPCWGADIPIGLLSEVQIVMKTGVAERERMEAFLETFGSCIPNILIVSDASYNIGDHNVHDVLADLPASYADDNPDWAVYAEQRETLTNHSAAHLEKSPAGWKLDRFKFLPMVEHAHATAPHAKWYVFIEADIYFFWDSLFRMLSTLDPAQYHYLGAATPGSYDRWFAYGGGGTILSGRLVRDLLHNGQRRLSAVPEYEEWVKSDCCGDAVLAYVIHKEMNIRVQSLKPMLSGQEVRELKIDRGNWCLPLVGVHRVSPELMRRLWRWERCRPATKEPITYATFMDFLITPVLRKGMDWDNGADVVLPEDSPAHAAASMCRRACAQEPTCLQYSYSAGNRQCRIADFIAEGGPAPEVFSSRDYDALRQMGYTPNGDPGEFCGKVKWLIPHDPGAKVQW